MRSLYWFNISRSHCTRRMWPFQQSCSGKLFREAAYPYGRSRMSRMKLRRYLAIWALSGKPIKATHFSVSVRIWTWCSAGIITRSKLEIQRPSEVFKLFDKTFRLVQLPVLKRVRLAINRVRDTGNDFLLAFHVHPRISHFYVDYSEILAWKF